MPDPAIPPLARSTLPERWRVAADTAERMRGEATLIEVLANNPDVLAWYYDSFYGAVFQKGCVDRRTKELLRLKLSTLHGCAYCNRGNTRAAVESGVTEEQIDNLATPEAACFSARDRAVLAMAEEMALQNQGGVIGPELAATLRAHFSNAEVVELGVVAAVLTGMAKFLFAFDLVTREESCPFGRPRV